MRFISNFKFQTSNLRGFTLIELIVVFSVIAILSTVGVASFVSYSKAQTLQQARNDFVTILNTAKSRSSAQVKPSSQCLSNRVLEGYSVTINIPARTYSLNIVCSGIATVLSTATLPTNVTFNAATDTPPTTTTNIVFSVLTGGVTGTGSVVLNAYNATRTVTINSVGGIQ